MDGARELRIVRYNWCVLNRETIASKFRTQSNALQTLGVRRLSDFGSAARGEADASSDLDFLVEFEGLATFDQYMSLKELLEQLFERQIDLVTHRAL
jgi:predicted nucleotidyltransferase